jgi:hypothetical protein
VRFAGAALDKRVIAAWGDGAVWLNLVDRSTRTVPGTGRWTEAGALADVDGDGRADLVLDQAGDTPQLVWLHAPEWTRHVIAGGVDTRDVLPASLLGHRGVVVIHKQIQVRFYEIPAKPADAWPAQDL